MGDSSNNIYLMPLTIYCLVVTLLVLPIYADYNRNEQNLRDGTISINESYFNINSSEQVNQNSGVIGFFKNLVLVFTEPMPAFIITLFIVIPNLWLAVIIYDKIRG